MARSLREGGGMGVRAWPLREKELFLKHKVPNLRKKEKKKKTQWFLLYSCTYCKKHLYVIYYPNKKIGGIN